MTMVMLPSLKCLASMRCEPTVSVSNPRITFVENLLRYTYIYLVALGVLDIQPNRGNIELILLFSCCFLAKVIFSNLFIILICFQSFLKRESE